MSKVSVKDILILKDIMSNHVTCDEIQAQRFVQFLLDNGYFIPTSICSNTMSLKIPNEEIHHLFRAVYSKLYFVKYLKFDTVKINEFLKALNLLRMDEYKAASLIKFRESVIDRYRNKTMPSCEQAFQSSIYYLRQFRYIFSFKNGSY